MRFLSQLIWPNDGKTRFRAVPGAGRSPRPGRRLVVEALEPRRLLSGLTLTAAGQAAGFGLTTFATGFPEVSSSGPAGIAFPTTGGVLVDDAGGNLRLFPTDTDGQNAGSVAPINGIRYGFGLGQLNGTIYMAQGSNVVKLINNGASTQVVVSGIPGGAAAVLADPFNNMLYVDRAGNGAPIYVVDPVAQTVNVFENIAADGLALSADGKTLYAAIVGGAFRSHVLGFDITTKAMVFDSGAISGGVDGIAVGKGPVAGNLFVNTNGGTVVEVNLATAAQTLIASGGSRGDFVTVDPNNGTLLLTQSDRIMRLVPGVFAIPQLATTTTLDVAPTISSFGQPVTLTAVVATAGTGTPTGTVAFTIDGQAQAPVSLTEVGGSDQATFTTSTLTPGTHTITAAYSGDFTFASSGSDPVSQVRVNPMALTVTATSNTKVYDGTTRAAGVPTITSGSLAAGDTPNFTEAYSNRNVGTGLTLAPGGTVEDGNGGNNYIYTFVPISTGVITPAPLTIAADNQTKVYGAALPALTASYDGLVNDETPASLATPPTLTTTATASSPVVAGGYSITASAAVDPNYVITYAPGTLTIIPAKPTISVSAPGGTFDTSPFAATVTLSGAGNDIRPAATLENVSPELTYYVGSGTSGTDLGSTPPSAPGTYTVIAAFPGSTDYAATQSSPITFTIAQAKATITLTSSGGSSVYGQSVTFMATVTGVGTPTGSVTFTDGGAVLGTVGLDSSGRAALTTTSLAAGSQPIIATYSGSTDFGAATSGSTTVAVARAGTQVVLATRSVHKKRRVVSLALDVTVSPLAPGAGVPTGTLAFELMQKKNKVRILGTAPLSRGSATLAVKPNSVLKKSVTVLYGGDADFQASSSTASVSASGSAALVGLIPTPVFRETSRADFKK